MSQVPAPRGSGPEDQPGSDRGRQRVLDLLRQAPEGLGVMALAEQLGLHPNTVRFHLNRLVTAGLATRKVEEHSGPGRRRLIFAAASGDANRGRRSYRLLADMLAGFIAGTVADPAAEATQLGRTWGSYLTSRPAPFQRVTVEQALAELLRVLDDVGFAPQLAEDEDDDQRRVLLRHCPFLEVASAHREVVCSLHLGVMQGVLAELHAPVEATDLKPFVEPSLCVALVGSRRAAT